jgi:hypothetical protein
MHMTLLTIQEQQDQAQHGLQLTPEEMEEQIEAIENAWEEYCQARAEASFTTTM